MLQSTDPMLYVNMSTVLYIIVALETVDCLRFNLQCKIDLKY